MSAALNCSRKTAKTKAALKTLNKRECTQALFNSHYYFGEVVVTEDDNGNILLSGETRTYYEKIMARQTLLKLSNANGFKIDYKALRVKES